MLTRPFFLIIHVTKIPHPEWTMASRREKAHDWMVPKEPLRISLSTVCFSIMIVDEMGQWMMKDSTLGPKEIMTFFHFKCETKHGSFTLFMVVKRLTWEVMICQGWMFMVYPSRHSCFLFISFFQVASR